MKGFFITGTDTGIGKTVLSALLLAELRRCGINAAPMKPVQTGCIDLQRAPDLDYALALSRMKIAENDYKDMSPYRFEPACSPHLAAEMAGTEIELSTIIESAQTLAKRYDLLLVEGAGGVLVPINRRELMLDLMAVLKLPVILAARPVLGTINHTLLSVRALRSAGLNVAGIVFMESEPPSDGLTELIEEDNLIAIEQFGGVPILGKIPYSPALRAKYEDYSALPISVISAIEKIASGLNL